MTLPYCDIIVYMVPMTDESNSTKTCRKCGEVKALDDFFKASKGLHGRKGSCKACNAQDQFERKANWSEERRAAHISDYTTRNAAKTSEDWRRELLRAKYKMTLEDYDNLFDAQDGCCALCKRPQSEFVKTLAVDHDHSCCPGSKSCGKCIRGLLCQPCNQALGLLQDNADLMIAASEYVKTRKPVF